MTAPDNAKHPPGCSCDACDCECVAHCPVHPRITYSEVQTLRDDLRASRAHEAEMTAERDRVIKALDEMRAINAMLCHWYDEGMELLRKAGVDEDEESPLVDLAENMSSHLRCSDGYDFKKVRIFKGMEARAEVAEAKAARLEQAIRHHATRPDSRCGSMPDGSCVTMHQLCAAVSVKPLADDAAPDAEVT